MGKSPVYKKVIRERLARQREFFQSKEPGDILVYYNFWSISGSIGDQDKWG